MVGWARVTSQKSLGGRAPLAHLPGTVAACPPPPPPRPHLEPGGWRSVPEMAQVSGAVAESGGLGGHSGLPGGLQPT